MKICTACKTPRDDTEFYWTTRRNGERARHSKCKGCRRAQFQTWAKTSAGRAVKRAGILRREYGISEEQYAEMLAQQGGVCAICMQTERKKHYTGAPSRLCVDHDHKTGRPRALLCSACNVGLGSFQDDVRLLRAAAVYLDFHSTELKSKEAPNATPETRR